MWRVGEMVVIFVYYMWKSKFVTTENTPMKWNLQYSTHNRWATTVIDKPTLRKTLFEYTTKTHSNKPTYNLCTKELCIRQMCEVHWSHCRMLCIAKMHQNLFKYIRDWSVSIYFTYFTLSTEDINQWSCRLFIRTHSLCNRFHLVTTLSALSSSIQ